MGNQNCIQNINNSDIHNNIRKSKIEETYLFYKKINDYRFKNIYLLQNKDEIIYKIKFKFYNDEYLEIYKNKLIWREENDFYFKLLDFSIDFKNNILQNYYVISLYYKFPELNLYNHVLLNDKQKIINNNIDLTILTYNMLDSLEYLERNDIAHNDFTFNLISIESTKTFPYKKFIWYNNFKKSIYKNYLEKIINNTILFCSPHMFYLIVNEFKSISLPIIFKNNIFILGLIVLKLTLKTEFLPLYYIKNGQYVFELENLKKMINIFISKYIKKNKFLCWIIKELLEINEQKRLTATQLKSKIPSYEKFLLKIYDKI